MNSHVRSKFEYLGITYLQHLRDENGKPRAGKSWQETFETSDRVQAEKYLAASEMKYQWTDLGIRTEAKKAAVRRHEVTDEKCWYNANPPEIPGGGPRLQFLWRPGLSP